MASAAIGFSRGLTDILLLRMLLGLAEAVGPIASLSFIRRNFSGAEIGLPTAIYIAGQNFGPAAGALLGTQLIAQFSWRTMFIVTGLGALVWLPFWREMTTVYRVWDGPNYLTIARTLYTGIREDNPLLSYVYVKSYFYVHLPFYPLLIRSLSFLGYQHALLAEALYRQGRESDAAEHVRLAEQDASLDMVLEQVARMGVLAKLEQSESIARRGATLVYAVCSLTRAEGEGVVRRAVDRGLVSLSDAPLALPTVQRDPDGLVRLGMDGSDGYVIAVLRLHLAPALPSRRETPALRPVSRG